MPLIAFGLGFVFPSSAPEMRLGLFVTGTVHRVQRFLCTGGVYYVFYMAL
jgi:hypothetical protein